MAYLNPERNPKAEVQCPKAPYTIVGDLLAPGNVLAPLSVESDVFVGRVLGVCFIVVL